MCLAFSGSVEAGVYDLDSNELKGEDGLLFAAAEVRHTREELEVAPQQNLPNFKVTIDHLVTTFL